MRLTQAQLEAIKALENEHGQLTPRQVVEAAKDKRSPLHDLFDWDKGSAAAKWWEHQARIVINAVKIQVTTQEFSYRAPAYVVDTSVEGQGYRSVVSLKSDTANARESLIYTLNTAAGHLRRALDLAAPLGLSHEIDDLIEKIAGVHRMIESKAA